MATNIPEISVFLNPALCANTKPQENGVTTPCQKNATQGCDGCHLVQYCSRGCQRTDWKHHKATCKSALLKGTWQPEWVRDKRQPAFIGSDDVPWVAFGVQKYIWGNMPALNILQLENNEGLQDRNRDFNLLFAASGDLRNMIKSVVGLRQEYKGKCTIVLNDKEPVIVFRNAIMLLVALYFDAKTAVPMMIHLWYSALLPRSMVQALQSSILPLVEDVCKKIEDKPAGGLHAKTFTINDRQLRLVLRKGEWSHLAQHFQVPGGLTVQEANEMRRCVTLAPQRIDYRERSMLQKPGTLSLVDTHFRKEGVFVPHGSSLDAFDTPNPTLFQDRLWPMKDDSNPRAGWLHADYMKYAPAAKADEYGAVFFYVRELLLAFCGRLRKADISFQLFSVDAQQLGHYVDSMKFDRIEISNICDRGFLGPHTCMQVFSPLLKEKADNPSATLLMLFLNAAAETAEENDETVEWRTDYRRSMERLTKYMPLDPTLLGQIRSGEDLGRHPAFVVRTGCHSMLRNWVSWFDRFLEEEKVSEFAQLCKLKIKTAHTIVQPWPYTWHAGTTKEEFDILRASDTTGYERYLEFERAE